MYKKFKRWLKFDPPYALDADGWTEFEDKYRAEAPIRFWLTRTLPGKTVFPVKWKWELCVSWVRYRIVKYHVVKADLAYGYYDTPYLMLHINFKMLKDFVEIEKASMQRGWHEDDHWENNQTGITKLFAKIPWYRRSVFRSRELGLKYLAWETTLDDPYLDETEQSTRQAENARELMELYLWWVDTYENREEIPYPGREHYEERSIMYTMSSAYKKEHPDEHALISKWSDDLLEQEQQWEKEDDSMLARLITIRHCLWS